jgi:hypothetical protein
MARLEEILGKTFEGKSVVVKDQMLGFRSRPERWILLVETSCGKADRDHESFVVKIGPAEDIDDEIRGWDACRPAGLKHDLVFLELEEGVCFESGDPKVKLKSLRYGDAQQFLGVDDTVSFERAVLGAVKTNSPGTRSILTVINELYERIGHLFYRQSFVNDPAHKSETRSREERFVFDFPKLDEAIQKWRSDPACQTAWDDVNSLTMPGDDQFLDPVHYLGTYVGSLVPWRVFQTKALGKEETVVREPAWRKAETPTSQVDFPPIEKLIPRILHGSAHGDLHGRNILVGLIRDQAMWPVVFDYEDMSPGNRIGWDFVKLETELKIRSYLDVSPGGRPRQFIQDVQRFELELARFTEECHNKNHWPEEENAFATPSGRLRLILMAIRRQAAQHLGTNQGRPNEWLEEYYFLLTCYGVITSRFEGLQPRERLAALVSAGVAASRLSWPCHSRRSELTIAGLS